MGQLRLTSIILFLLTLNGIASTLEFNLQIETGHRILFLFIALVVAVFVLYFKSKEVQIQVLMGLCFLGNEPFVMLLPIVMLPKLIISPLWKGRTKLSQLGATLFIVYASILIMASNVDELAILNVGLWFVTFGAYFFIYLFYSGSTYSKESVIEILQYLSRLILLQVAVMILQAAIHRDFQPGDSWTGTSGNAILAGFFLIGYLIVYFFPPFLSFSRNLERGSLARQLLWAIVLPLLLYFNDSKMVILVFAVGLLLFSVIISFIQFIGTGAGSWFWKLTVTVVLSISLWVLANLGIRWYSESFYGGMELSDIVSPYVSSQLTDSKSNAKAVLYYRVFADMLDRSPQAWFFGVGPSRFGSRASNIMAYDVLFKDENQFKMPDAIGPYSSYWTRLYMSDLWTKEIAETSKFRSATLSFPFAGLVTIKAEYGLIGLFIYFLFIGTMIIELSKRAKLLELQLQRWYFLAGLFWFSLPLHMIFDNFQEKNIIILPMLLLTAVLTSVKGNETENGEVNHYLSR